MMNRILVYDCSLFGQALGKFLERELSVGVDVITDTFRPQDVSDREICERVAEKIKPYIGKVAGVVIANPLIVSVVVGELEKIFPGQRFVYYGKAFSRDVSKFNRMAVLAQKRIRRTERYQASKAACQEVEIEELNCGRWIRMIDNGWMGQEEIVSEFRHKLGTKIVIYHQGILMRERKLEEIVDWRGELIDMKKEMVLPLKWAIKEWNKAKRWQLE